MILGYNSGANGGDPHHFGIQAGVSRKFIRVIVGLIPPLFDRQLGAAVVLGENYAPSSSPSWIAFDGAADDWNSITAHLGQWRRDYKFTHVIVDTEPAREHVFKMRGVQYGIGNVPLSIYAAPTGFESELGRSTVASLIQEGRFLMPDAVSRELRLEPQAAKLAVQGGVLWALYNPAYYQPLRKGSRGIGDIMGVDGL